MLFGSRRVVMALVAFVFVVGCAAGYRTSTRNGHEKVYKVDDEGNKNLVYEVAADGTLTVHDESDPRAQQMLAAQDHQVQLQVLEEERIARIKEAPKRAASDPIRVVLHQMNVDEKLSQAQHTEGAIEEQFRKEFAGDKIIRIVEPVASQGSELTQVLMALSGKTPTEAESAGPAADVEVVTRAYVEEKAGYNKSSKKFGTYAALVYEATIKSNYLPAEYTITEEGNVFRNAEVTKRLAEQIKSVIKHKIGPTIPADREL
jgi:hypothetical protein